MRVPDVEDEYRAEVFAVVPSFMFDGVIKCKGLADFPLAGFSPHPEAAAFGDDQRQMDDRAGVSNAGVRRDMRLWLEDREESRWRAARHFCAGNAVEHRHRHRAAFASILNPLAVFDQIIGAP